jgi:DNA-binding NarL/FixJ family response regulator
MLNTNPYRILLADDHAILRQNLKVILKKQSHLEVIEETGDGVELLHLLNSNAMVFLRWSFLISPCQNSRE